MFRIAFLREGMDWGDDHGKCGCIFEPEKETKFPFDLFGYKIWSSSFHIFVVRQQNPFSTLETLLHEIGHLVIYGLFFCTDTAHKINWLYDYLHWKLMRLWHLN